MWQGDSYFPGVALPTKGVFQQAKDSPLAMHTHKHTMVLPLHPRECPGRTGEFAVKRNASVGVD